MNQPLFSGMSLVGFVSTSSRAWRFAQSDVAKLENDKGEELLLGEVTFWESFMEWPQLQVSHEKKTGWLGYIGDEILPSEGIMYNRPL